VPTDAEPPRKALTPKSFPDSEPQQLDDPPADSLAGRVRNALFAVPENFGAVRAPTLEATEIHTLGAVLGSSIESQVVDTLNRVRTTTWDPNGELTGYRFVRQAQVFPDVVLKATDPDAHEPIKLGIELKGWYVLAKEKKPNFRFTATPLSCSEQDMLVVFPWALSQVISGNAQVLSPWIGGARYAAEYRNWHWLHRMAAGEDGAGSPSEREIRLSSVTKHYPESKTEEHNDEAMHDKGHNFGRIARTGLMRRYIDQVFDEEELAGVQLRYWQRFLRLFGRDTPSKRIIAAIDQMGKEVSGRGRAARLKELETLREQVTAIARTLDSL
jgi:hypothetical protein